MTKDAVAPAAKDAARAVVAQWLSGLPAAAENPVQVWIRINSGDMGHTDVRAVLGPAVTGVVAAKTESAEELVALHAVLTAMEDKLELPAGSIGVVPLLESANAVLNALSIAKAPRVQRLQVGEADLRADIGVELGADGRELLYVRSQVVLISAAAGIDPPVGPVDTNFRDTEALAESTRAVKRMGYVGRACIHPAQAAVVNEVFTPTADEVAAAKDLIARFDAAMAAGDGVCLDAQGRMVDEAVVRQARRTLSLAR
ncbi:MAG: aldolase/citrate lyase family protein [Actinobacteria bacterium]|nr:aldolase/citrate lyase family protein [Actinomycetota bacterium]